MKEFWKDLKRICFNPIKEEVKEIKNLVPTEEDREQGKKLAFIAVAALSGMGVPLSAFGTEIIAKAMAYGIRDLKDGLECHEKLIVARIIKEIKEGRQEEKSKEPNEKN